MTDGLSEVRGDQHPRRMGRLQRPGTSFASPRPRNIPTSLLPQRRQGSPRGRARTGNMPKSPKVATITYEPATRDDAPEVTDEPRRRHSQGYIDPHPRELTPTPTVVGSHRRSSGRDEGPARRWIRASAAACEALEKGGRRHRPSTADHGNCRTHGRSEPAGPHTAHYAQTPCPSSSGAPQRARGSATASLADLALPRARTSWAST